MTPLLIALGIIFTVGAGYCAATYGECTDDERRDRAISFRLFLLFATLAGITFYQAGVANVPAPTEDTAE